MSDVCMYELEDIVCNDMYEADDHVVPCSEDHSFQHHSHKNNHHGAKYIEPRAENLHCVHQISPEKAEQANLTAIHQRSNMLEKQTWLKKSCSGFPPCNSESINESSSLVSDDGTKTSNQCFLGNIQSSRSEICVNDSILSDQSPKVSNSSDFRCDHISEAENDLSFLGNNQDKKPANDLLHYSWADIGNFDDVDRMFRSYDSTFGQGISHEDNLNLLPLSNATGESGDAFNMDSKFSCPDFSSLRSVEENDDKSRFINMSCSVNGSDMQMPSNMYKGSSWSSFSGESGHFGPLSFSNGSGCSGDKDNNDYFMPKGQINEQNKQLKHQNQADISENDHYLEDSPIFYVESVAESGKQQANSLEPQSFGYLQGSTPYMSSYYNCQPEQNSLQPPQSVIKSENSSPTSFSLNDSCSLNQMQSTEGSKQSSLQEISFASENRRQIHLQRGLQIPVSVNPENVDLDVQASTCDMISEKAIPYSAENHIDGKANVGVSFDSGFSTQYSSMSSGLKDISLEATSFRQLQNAMERLDLRTKLCIRDSLYRLARSAEQRHVNMNGGSRDDTDSMSADKRNKFIMDIETETNPIDRSIAHLLFHRPADSSVLAGGRDSSFKAPAPIHGCSNSSPGIADDSIKQEQTAAEPEKNLGNN